MSIKKENRNTKRIGLVVTSNNSKDSKPKEIKKDVTAILENLNSKKKIK